MSYGINDALVQLDDVFLYLAAKAGATNEGPLQDQLRSVYSQAAVLKSDLLNLAAKGVR